MTIYFSKKVICLGNIFLDYYNCNNNLFSGGSSASSGGLSVGHSIAAGQASGGAALEYNRYRHHHNVHFGIRADDCARTGPAVVGVTGRSRRYCTVHPTNQTKFIRNEVLVVSNKKCGRRKIQRTYCGSLVHF